MKKTPCNAWSALGLAAKGSLRNDSPSTRSHSGEIRGKVFISAFAGDCATPRAVLHDRWMECEDVLVVVRRCVALEGDGNQNSPPELA